MAKKSSPTMGAVARAAMPMQAGVTKTESVRKADGGYIQTTSSYDDKGNYRSTERVSVTNPGDAGGNDVKPGDLERAMRGALRD